MSIFLLTSSYSPNNSFRSSSIFIRYARTLASYCNEYILSKSTLPVSSSLFFDHSTSLSSGEIRPDMNYLSCMLFNKPSLICFPRYSSTILLSTRSAITSPLVIHKFGVGVPHSVRSSIPHALRSISRSYILSLSLYENLSSLLDKRKFVPYGERDGKCWQLSMLDFSREMN